MRLVPMRHDYAIVLVRVRYNENNVVAFPWTLDVASRISRSFNEQD